MPELIFDSPPEGGAELFYHTAWEANQLFLACGAQFR